jgi:maltose phosphorylase
MSVQRFTHSKVKVNTKIEDGEWEIKIKDLEGGKLKHNKVYESLCSIGNGRIGQRGNFEEGFSEEKETLRGNYVGGIFFPDKTRVGWWKNGYPDFFAKVINSIDWIEIGIFVNDVKLDLAKGEIEEFTRVLDMKNGLFKRTFIVKLSNGNKIEVNCVRFLSMKDKEIGAIKYEIKALNFKGKIKICPGIDGDIKNEDSNNNEKFWEKVEENVKENFGYVCIATKENQFKTEIFQECVAMKYEIKINEKEQKSLKYNNMKREKYIKSEIEISIEKGETLSIFKYASILSSMNHKGKSKEDTSKILIENSSKKVEEAYTKGFENLLKEHIETWHQKWLNSDIQIQGDTQAQQAIRFNIFQLNCTYTGDDHRLNIGPKGFTGEKYGGATYWDTEAYCFLYYLCTSHKDVAKQLLFYRKNQLEKAILNGEKLGFKHGAACYPMVTMTGDECHNEWEITMEEIHRNGAIARAIAEYTKFTKDTSYLHDHGIFVLTAISRFWSQRVNFSKEKNKYVMLGVTGPNEYENNVHNNWYTNYIAKWCLEYTLNTLENIQKEDIKKYENLKEKLEQQSNRHVDTKTLPHIKLEDEMKKWKDIVDKMYLPIGNYEGKSIFLQQDGYLDKELLTVKELPSDQKPIHQNWSWDRILRSCFIKQADVLQGIYFFEENFTNEQIQNNFKFYEPKTVHESSLSSCVHCVIAAKIASFTKEPYETEEIEDEKEKKKITMDKTYEDKAYEFYINSARLDLNNINNDTEDGCHITSMAGTWTALIVGIAGMRLTKSGLTFNPMLPQDWTNLSFNIVFDGKVMKVKIFRKEGKVVTEIEK